MDEDEYRAIYREINQTRCIFEKAINNRRCDCKQKQRFLLATREGVGCSSDTNVAQCTQFLDTLRDKSRFTLKVITVDGPLPHNKELRVQAGGCLALQQIIDPNFAEKTVDDIHHLLDSATHRFGNIESIPYDKLIKGVLRYKSRDKKRH